MSIPNPTCLSTIGKRTKLAGVAARHTRTLLVAATTAAIMTTCPLARSETKASDLTRQRSVFVQAERAINSGQTTRFRDLLRDLHGYPLLPYLEYAELSRRLNRLDHKEIAAFEGRYPDAPLTSRLHTSWLASLAAGRRSEELIKYYQPGGSVTLECQYRAALIRQGRSNEALRGVEALWLVGQSQPDACDTVFAAWESSGKLTQAVIWQRIRLAMEAGNTRLAEHLGKRLPATDRPWVQLWTKVIRDPTLVFAQDRFQTDHSMRSHILTHGIVRMGYRDPQRATKGWDELKNRYSFTPEQRAQVERTLALLLAQSKDPEALPRLEAVGENAATARIREWRVRAALDQRNWVAVLTAIETLSAEEQSDTRWRYWRGRALEALGFVDAAREIYADLSTTRNYHSFLAADRIGANYELENAPLQLAARDMRRLEEVPGIARSRELYKLQRTVDARREWEYTMQRLDGQSMAHAAKLAEEWGWHSNAIFTAARSGYWHDLDLRFPVLYEKSVLSGAKEFNIEAAWIYGIVRQESAFMVDARSPRGAMGLMQLLPSTARSVAPRAKTSLRRSNELFSPEKNIQLGSAYLQQVRGTLNDHPVLATAAYNAGPTKVRNWIPEREQIPADLWIETIPYDETRDYVERVMAYTVIYDWQLTGHPMRLREFMPPVGNPSEKASESPHANDVRG
jgi:soluble lytic murein transglycosylase